MNAITRLINFLANLGLLVRDDPPHKIDLTGREWGEKAGGLALSIRPAKSDDPDQVPPLSVVLRNTGATAKTLVVPGWLSFYTLQVMGPDGSPAALTPYGQRLLDSTQQTAPFGFILSSGGANETILPVEALFNVRAPGEYSVVVSCTLPGGVVLNSNRVRFQVNRRSG